MAQVGVLSLSQLQIHDHYDYNSGGPINLLTRTASATVKMLSAPAVMSAAGVGTWSMMKRILVGEDSPGTSDLLFTMTRAGGAGTVHGQIRIQRGATNLFTGVDNSTAAGPTIYTDAAAAVDLKAQDTIEVWGYVSVGATTICTVETLQVCYTGTFTKLTRRILNTALQTSAASDVLYTAVS